MGKPEIHPGPDASENPLRAIGAINIAAGSRCEDKKNSPDHPAKNLV